MMRRIDSNGEPRIHNHQCSPDRKGKPMTDEELREFAIEALIEEYAEAKVVAVRREKKASNEADFSFNRGEKTINVIVLYKHRDKDVPEIDTSWMEQQYYDTGAIPRLTLANAWCFEGEEDGEPAICGGSFCFTFYSGSLLPDEKNEPMEKTLTDTELAVKFLDMWNNLDADIIAPYLDKDFHYGSEWVFDELPSRREYLDYIKGKLATIKRTGAKPIGAICRNKQLSRVAVALTQGNNKSMLALRTENGRIISAKMMKYDDKYEFVDPADELYMNHGDHIDAIMPVSEFTKNHLHKVIEESTDVKKVQTEVTTNELFKETTDVFSMIYGSGDARMLSLIAFSKYSNTNQFITTFPLLKGNAVEVIVEKVIEWDNQLEATVLCATNDFHFAFFATDYYRNKMLYKKGGSITISLSSLGCKVEEAEHGFSFEGEQAIEWLSKIGEKPDFDSDGRVKPVNFNMEKLVAFLNHNSKCPDEAEFQSPSGAKEDIQFLGVDFYKTNIVLHRDENDQELSISLYFKKEFVPNLKESLPIRGWIWLMGEII